MIGLYMMPEGIGPKRYLNKLFAQTENGVLTLSHQGLYYEYPLVTECKMSWKAENIPVLYREFQTLRDKLQEMAANLKEPERDDQPWTAPAVRELIHEPGKLQRKAESLCITMRLTAGWKESIIRKDYCEFIEELALARFCTEKKRIKQDSEYWVNLVFLERVKFEICGDNDFLCAKMRTTGPKGYRVNVFDVGYDFDVNKGDLCAFRLVGTPEPVSRHTPPKKLCGRTAATCQSPILPRPARKIPASVTFWWAGCVPCFLVPIPDGRASSATTCWWKRRK